MYTYELSYGVRQENFKKLVLLSLIDIHMSEIEYLPVRAFTVRRT